MSTENRTKTAIEILKQASEKIYGETNGIREEWITVMHKPKGADEETPLMVDGKEFKFKIRKLDSSDKKDRSTLAAVGGFFGQFSNDKIKRLSEIKEGDRVRDEEIASLASGLILDWSFSPEVTFDTKSARAWLVDNPGVSMLVLSKAADLGNDTTSN